MGVFDTAWAQLGAVGVVFLFVLLLAMGKLVPRTIAKSLVDQANDNADRWQAAARASDERADLFARQNTELLQAMRTVEALVRALQPIRGDPK